MTLSLKGLPKLEYVAFEGNPVEETIPMFKYYIANELPKVKYLDWTQISKDDRTKGMTLDLSNTWKGKNDITARCKHPHTQKTHGSLFIFLFIIIIIF